ncbi:protoporphyrinogen oxidase [Halapricum desulfuricans]|uniref:Protoporphyrinogen oxidase n=1 Tax=Halapricum desulfuricans TaxID=2841257 RepID=A0A897NEI2_9EURY|nr:protoporphyrinogen oxidase [Halapricum desulfuricans]QSG09855.1 Protoporphyrinogen oxidase [Halapricum desulfuricans]
MHVGVIGAGISGLATAHELRERGVTVDVFEADDEPGGIVRSRRVDGHVLDLGPQRLRGSKLIEEWIDEFGLREQRFEGHDDQPLFVLRDGKLRVAPLSIHEAITTDLISWPGKARILAEPLTGPPRPDETVADFFARKFGNEAERTLFSPLYTGLYGAHADEMLVRHSVGKALRKRGIDRSILLAVARKLLEGVDIPPIVSLEDGLQTLPKAIADRYAESIHLETPVEAVYEDGNDFDIVTADGSTAVDRVVVTTPAPITADLLEPLDGDLADVLSGLTYNPLAIVHLESNYGREGHGCQILDGEGYETLGLTWNASMLDRDGVFTVYLGGSRSPELLEESDDRLGELAAEEFESITGFSARPSHVARWRPGMPAYDASWNDLDHVSFPDGVHVCATYTERAGIPGRLRDAKRTAEAIAGE